MPASHHRLEADFLKSCREDSRVRQEQTPNTGKIGPLRRERFTLADS
jgi:hypothetical protein